MIHAQQLQLPPQCIISHTCSGSWDVSLVDFTFQHIRWCTVYIFCFKKVYTLLTYTGRIHTPGCWKAVLHWQLPAHTLTHIDIIPYTARPRNCSSFDCLIKASEKKLHKTVVWLLFIYFCRNNLNSLSFFCNIVGNLKRHKAKASLPGNFEFLGIWNMLILQRSTLLGTAYILIHYL